MLTQEEVKKLLDYNPDTGEFIWKRRENVKETWNSRYAGKIAGSYNQLGYRKLAIHNKTYKLHRVVWLYVYGYWPKLLDHINGVRDDNRIDNLREVSQSMNRHNMSLINTKSKYSELRGVTFCKKVKKWKAQITRDRKCYFIGHYDNPEDAHLAYLEAKIKYHNGYIPNSRV